MKTLIHKLGGYINNNHSPLLVRIYYTLIKNKVMILFIFILVYLISVAICLITCYYENKNYIHDIGDLLDETEGFMWCPFINTVFIIVFCLCLGAVALWELFKLNILWEKFKNIKIR